VIERSECKAADVEVKADSTEAISLLEVHDEGVGLHDVRGFCKVGPTTKLS